MVENARIQKLNSIILSNFQTMCACRFSWHSKEMKEKIYGNRFCCFKRSNSILCPKPKGKEMSCKFPWGNCCRYTLHLSSFFFMSICIFDLRYDEIETNCSSTLLCSKFPTQKGMKTATRFLDFKRRGRLWREFYSENMLIDRLIYGEYNFFLLLFFALNTLLGNWIVQHCEYIFFFLCSHLKD